MLLECLKENFINCEIKEFKVEVNGFMFEVTYNPNQSGGSYILHYKYNKFEDWDIAKDPESIWDRINGFFAFIEDIKLSPEMYRDSYIAEMQRLGCSWINVEQINKTIKEVMGDDYEIK